MSELAYCLYMRVVCYQVWLYLRHVCVSTRAARAEEKREFLYYGFLSGG